MDDDFDLKNNSLAILVFPGVFLYVRKNWRKLDKDGEIYVNLLSTITHRFWFKLQNNELIKPTLHVFQ